MEQRGPLLEERAGADCETLTTNVASETTAGPPPGWDAEAAGDRIREQAQAERLQWARSFAALHSDDSAVMETEALEALHRWDELVAEARADLAAERR